MTALSRIGLGTAQFGAHYGVSNRGGRPHEREVAAILERAIERGVGYLDTAPAYGDAEELIGRHLPAGHRLRIITKTPPIPEERIEARHARQWLDALAASLDRLKASSVHGLLVHHVADLGKPGWQHLVDALQEAKARGFVTRIGVSIYDAEQLALAESRLDPQLVQLPLNLLDRRLLASGTLARLKGQGIELHARSIFLQGLLLMAPADLPEFFRPLRPTLAGLHGDWAAHGLSPLAACLAFVLRQSGVDAAIVGVNSLAEFDEIELAVAATAGSGIDFGKTPVVDPLYLDPSRWPSLVH